MRKLERQLRNKYAYDPVLKAESEQIETFGRWREGTEARGLKINLKKMKVMVTGKDANHSKVMRMALWMLWKRSESKFNFLC